MDEQWSSLAKVEFSKYAVSSYGRIYNMITGKFLKGTKGKNRYITVCIIDDKGISKRKSIHYLVASMFCFKGSEDNLTVDHINRIQDDNRAVNLRWTTRREQLLNRTTQPTNKYGRSVIQYDINGDFIAKWDKISYAEIALGIQPGGISKACKYYTLCGNYYWRYYVESYPDEVWQLVPYPDYETLYASSYGRILKSTGHITKGSLINEYLVIGVYDNVQQKYVNKRVHRLIAAAFFGRNDQLIVNHKDGNTNNNHIDNLEFITQRENCIHAVQTGLTSNQRKVMQFDLNGNLINQYNSIVEAISKLGIKSDHISAACAGHRKTAGRY